MVDASDLRRGRDTANAVWGNKPAVLVGDFLFSRSFELMVADGSLRILEILSRASSIIAEGEVLQLMTQNDIADDRGRLSRGDPGKDRGAVRGGEPDRRGRRRAAARRRRRRSTGSAAISASPFSWSTTCSISRPARPSSARAIGDDFRDGKITLPILLALARGDEEERAFWRRTLEDMEQRPGDLEHAMQLVRAPRRPRRDPVARPALRGDGDRRAGDIRGRGRAAGADRGGLLSPPTAAPDGLAGLRAACLGAASFPIYRARSAECSSAW